MSLEHITPCFLAGHMSQIKVAVFRRMCLFCFVWFLELRDNRYGISNRGESLVKLYIAEVVSYISLQTG